MEIIKFKEVNKNTLQASFSLKIPKWGNFIINDILYFKKDNNRWIALPSKEYEHEGKKKYHWYIHFEDPKIMEGFQKKVLQAIDEYLAKTLPSVHSEMPEEPNLQGVPF